MGVRVLMRCVSPSRNSRASGKRARKAASWTGRESAARCWPGGRAGAGMRVGPSGPRGGAPAPPAGARGGAVPPGVGHGVQPLPALLVEVGPGGEGAAGEEVVLEVVEGALDLATTFLVTGAPD